MRAVGPAFPPVIPPSSLASFLSAGGELSASRRKGRGVAGLGGSRAGRAPGFPVGAPPLLEGGRVSRRSGAQHEPEHDAQDHDDGDVDEM